MAISELDNTVQMFVGSVYVNNFNAFGRSWQVNIQADGQFRTASGGPQPAQRPQRVGPDGAARDRWSRSATAAAR